MTVSQNGYSANDRSVIGSYTVPGTTTRVALRKGDVSVVLLEFARRFHLEVQSIDQGPLDDWGYAERLIRGSATVVSNHASGTALDLNATQHPLAKVGTFSPSQAATIRRILADLGNVLRWGGDYHGRRDEMHVEVNAGAAAMRAVADRLRQAAGTGPAPAPPVTAAEPPPFPLPASSYYGPEGGGAESVSGYHGGGEGLKRWQAQMAARGWAIRADGLYGSRGDRVPAGQTADVARRFQAEKGLAADGLIGPATWAAAWAAPVT